MSSGGRQDVHLNSKMVLITSISSSVCPYLGVGIPTFLIVKIFYLDINVWANKALACQGIFISDPIDLCVIWGVAEMKSAGQAARKIIVLRFDQTG